MALPILPITVSPSRKRMAQPVLLSPAFSSSMHAISKEVTLKPGINNFVLGRLQGLACKEDRRSTRGKEETRLKRTLEGVVSNMEKMARKLKVMSSRSTDACAAEDPTLFARCMHSNEVLHEDLSERSVHPSRSILIKSPPGTIRERRRSRVEKSSSHRATFHSHILDTRFGLKSSKKLQLDSFSKPSPLRSSSDLLASSLGSPVLLLPHDFPASAGAGARAAVASLKNAQSSVVFPSHPAIASVYHDSLIDDDNEKENDDDDDDDDLELVPCEETRDDSLYESDRMEVDLPDVAPDEDLPSYPSEFVVLNTRHVRSLTFLLDPLLSFPLEVVEMIFSHVDMPTLESLRSVSKDWKAVVESNHIWRHVFLAKHGPSSGPQSYLKIGGQGIGKLMKPTQDYRAMAVARRKLEKRWATQDAKATYFCGHSDSVYCCQFDETKIITGSRDRTIRIWDMKKLCCIKVIGAPVNRPRLPSPSTPSLETHPQTIHNIRSVNGTCYGNSIYHSPAYFHYASILCLQYDAEIMVTGSSDTTCIVWSMTNYEPLARLQRHQAGVLDICFDDKFIISCSKDYTICVWSRTTYELIKVLEGHHGPVNAVQMRGNMLVSASGDGNAKLWDLSRMQSVRTFKSQDRGLAAVEFSDDGRYVLAGGNDQVIYKYDAHTCTLLHKYEGHTNLVRSLFLDYSNHRVLSGSYDQGMRVFDFDTGLQTGVYNNWTTSWILAAKCDYRRIVATSQDGRVLLMDFGYNIENVDLLANSE